MAFGKAVIGEALDLRGTGLGDLARIAVPLHPGDEPRAMRADRADPPPPGSPHRRRRSASQAPERAARRASSPSLRQGRGRRGRAPRAPLTAVDIGFHHPALIRPGAHDCVPRSPDAGTEHQQRLRRPPIKPYGDLTCADDRAERKAALDMLHRYPRIAPAADLGCQQGIYDAVEFVADLREACVPPHLAKKARHSAIDGHTTRHKSHAQPRKQRKRIEETFGWAKTVGGMSQTAYTVRRDSSSSCC